MHLKDSARSGRDLFVAGAGINEEEEEEAIHVISYVSPISSLFIRVYYLYIKVYTDLIVCPRIRLFVS
jgi:hypothetical protein